MHAYIRTYVHTYIHVEAAVLEGRVWRDAEGAWVLGLRSPGPQHDVLWLELTAAWPCGLGA